MKKKRTFTNKNMGCSNSASAQVNANTRKKIHLIFIIGGLGCIKESLIKRIRDDFDIMPLSIGNSFTNLEKYKITAESVMKGIILSFYTTPFYKYMLYDFPINKEYFEKWEKQANGHIKTTTGVFFELSKEEMKKRILEKNKAENEGSINEKISTFEKEVKPVLSIFEQKKSLIKINAMKTEEEIFDDIFKLFNEREIVEPGGPNVIFVIGGPGSGKSTQCERIVREFNYISISADDLLRSHIMEKRKPECEGAYEDMKEGIILPAEYYILFIKELILRYSKGNILLRDFPRCLKDMEMWNKNIKGKANIKAAHYFEISPEEMKKRIFEKKEKRFDDTEKRINNRISFCKYLPEVLSLYERRKMLIKIDGMKTVDEIAEEIKKKCNFKEASLIEEGSSVIN